MVWNHLVTWLLTSAERFWTITKSGLFSLKSFLKPQKTIADRGISTLQFSCFLNSSLKNQTRLFDVCSLQTAGKHLLSEVCTQMTH